MGLGNLATRFIITNEGASTCRLMGYPVLIGVTAKGAESVIDAGHETYFGEMVPGDLRPGADGELLIGGGRQCLFEPASAEPPGGPQRMPFRSIVVDLPDDEGSFSVTHFPPCSPIDDSGLGVPPPPQPDAVVTPTAGTLASLQARARVPERVQAGRRLDYVVVLSNRGSKAVLAATLSAHEPATLDVHKSASLFEHGGALAI